MPRKKQESMKKMVGEQSCSP